MGAESLRVVVRDMLAGTSRPDNLELQARRGGNSAGRVMVTQEYSVCGVVQYQSRQTWGESGAEWDGASRLRIGALRLQM